MSCQRGNIVILTLCLLGAFNLASAEDMNEQARSAADVFLRKLTAAPHQGMGGSFVGSITGANALNSNPAGLSLIEGDRFVAHAARFPRTVAVVSKLNAVERHEDFGRYDLRASGFEAINYITPMDNGGVIGFDLAFEFEGQFSRVNHLGKATNNFPASNLAIGIGYGRRLIGELFIGADAKWIRSKVLEADYRGHIGHGYAYNLGAIQQIGKALRIGIVVRNLSNGLSFSDDSIPDKIRRDVLFGAAYQRRYKDVNVRVGFDLNPPFEDGIRTGFGGEVWYRGRIGGQIGYLRHTENRIGSIFNLETEQTDVENRLWKVEGLTVGLGVNLGIMNINAAYIPQMKPQANTAEQIRIDQGRSVYYFSVGRSF